MKYLIVITVLGFFSCTEQPVRRTVQDSTPIEEPIHPDSMEVCCAGKCTTVSWEMYKAMDLNVGAKACAYIETKLK